MARRPLIACAALVGAAAFLLYHATLLPGFDFGDTGSFQTTVGSVFIRPRDGYPLYFALGNAVLWISGAEPAHALNLASAIEGAVACAMIVLVAADLSGSVVAAGGVALLVAGSYTFWSQAIIAEVYALHILFVAATVLALLRWERQPTTGRLALFFVLYALGFGNHLSMILLAPAYTIFILTAAPGGWRSVVTPRIVVLAAICAIAGALQYAWNIWSMLSHPHGPLGVADIAWRFWFDVTKEDWRETMVMHVPNSMLLDRAAMYRFDLHQQFGTVAFVLAPIGLAALAFENWRRGLLMLLLYLVNLGFAYSYNVGDAHVFYLPSHLIVALLCAPAVVFLGRRLTRRWPVVAVALVLYAGARAYLDYPALDRSRDHRPTEVLTAFTSGLDDEHAVLLADLNWQVQNGLSYFGHVTKRDLAYTRMIDVILYAPALVADNHEIGRDIALSEASRDEMIAAYGPLLPTHLDPRVAAGSIEAATRDLPRGTRYVLCNLKPLRDSTIDWQDVGRSLAGVGGGAAMRVPGGDYVAIAGVVGKPPVLAVGTNAPFRRAVILDGVEVQVRMDSWLAMDTIRRMGFGHVIVGRQHTLIVERGVSFVAFDASGVPIRTAYAGNIFAPLPRYIVER